MLEKNRIKGTDFFDSILNSKNIIEEYLKSNDIEYKIIMEKTIDLNYFKKMCVDLNIYSSFSYKNIITRDIQLKYNLPAYKDIISGQYKSIPNLELIYIV